MIMSQIYIKHSEINFIGFHVSKIHSLFLVIFTSRFKLNFLFPYYPVLIFSLIELIHSETKSFQRHDGPNFTNKQRKTTVKRKETAYIPFFICFVKDGYHSSLKPSFSRSTQFCRPQSPGAGRVGTNAQDLAMQPRTTQT